VNTNKKYYQNAVLIFTGAIEIIQKTGYNHTMMFKMGGYVFFCLNFLNRDGRRMKISLIAAVAAGSAGGSNVLGSAAQVVVIGVVVVFLALVALTAVFWVFGRAAYRKSDHVADEEAAEPDFQPMAPPMEFQEDISDEIVAVIAAAVAAMAPDGVKYAVRKVRRVRGERPVWAAAGIAENTRPF